GHLDARQANVIGDELADAAGRLFHERDDAVALLVPFVRRRHSGGNVNTTVLRASPRNRGLLRARRRSRERASGFARASLIAGGMEPSQGSIQIVERGGTDLAQLAALACAAAPDSIVELLHAVEQAVVRAREAELEVALARPLRAEAGA